MWIFMHYSWRIACYAKWDEIVHFKMMKSTNDTLKAIL